MDICRTPIARPRRAAPKAWNTATLPATAMSDPKTPKTTSAPPSTQALGANAPSASVAPAPIPPTIIGTPHALLIDQAAGQDERQRVADGGCLQQGAERRGVHAVVRLEVRSERPDPPLDDRERGLRGDRQAEDVAPLGRHASSSASSSASASV